MILKSVSTLFLFVSCFPLVAQDIQDVLDRNPFDRQRGARDSPPEPDEPQVSDEEDYDLILYGTLMADARRYAIIGARPTSASAIREAREEQRNQASNGAKNNRNARVIRNRRVIGKRTKTRTSGNRALEETKVLEIGDAFKGYKITEIDRQSVALTKAGVTEEISLYSGKKTDRGGSKMVAKKAVKPKIRNAKKEPERPRNNAPKNQKKGLKRADTLKKRF